MGMEQTNIYTATNPSIQAMDVHNESEEYPFDSLQDIGKDTDDMICLMKHHDKNSDKNHHKTHKGIKKLEKNLKGDTKMSKREFEMIPMSIGAQPAYGGGYNNCGSGWFGGGAGGAFAGGLAGGLLGDLFFGRRGYGGYGCYGDGGGYGHGGAGTVVQVNENDGRGRGGNISQWELMKEMSDTRREVAVMPYIAENTALEQTIAINQLMAGTNAHINGLQMQICQCCNESQRLELEGQYKMLLMQAGISREMSECCCKQLHATTVMGYETQLRDQAQFGAIMAEMKDIKCLVTDTAKATELREAYAKIAQLERVNLAQDIKETVTCGPRKVEIKEDFVRPLTPQYIPYYPARAVPQEDFSRGGCDNRWNFNNNGGFQ